MSNKIIGNPTVTPVKLPIVDQTYNGKSENAQSGKAVAEALSKVIGGDVDLSNYYTKAETDNKISSVTPPLWQPDTEYKVGDRVTFEVERNGLIIKGTAVCKEEHTSNNAWRDIMTDDESDLWDVVSAPSAYIAEQAVTAMKDIDGEFFYKKFEVPERLAYYGDGDIIPTDENFFECTFNRENMTASVVLTDGVKGSIGNATIVIPHKVGGLYKITAIGDNAFKGVSVGSVIIPNSVTSIGNGAFHNFFAADGVTIPKSVNNVSGRLFDNDMGMNLIRCDAESWISSYAQKNGFTNVQYINKVTQNYIDEKLGDIESLLQNI